MVAWADYHRTKPLSAPLTAFEESFIQHLVDDNMSPGDAYNAARADIPEGIKTSRQKRQKNPYDDGAINAKVRGMRLERHLWPHINQRIKDRVGNSARQAVQVLEQLMTQAESENVRLNAARDILSRAGYDAVQKQETTFKDITALSDTEIDEQLSNILKDTGNNIVSMSKGKRSA
jgi:hypothetical protein